MIGILHPGRDPRLAPLNTVDNCVKAFEAAWAESGPVEVEAFLPPPDDPNYAAAARELVRVDMEFRWECGQTRDLEDYRRALPAPFGDSETVAAVAFEEFRQRLDRGDQPDAAEYARKYGVDTSGWAAAAAPRTVMLESAAGLVTASRLYKECRDSGNDPETVASPGAAAAALNMLRAVHRTNPAAASRLADAALSLPNAGDEFQGFRLEAELGRGAFGRVFLARQSELADRLIALKVTPAELDAGPGTADESQTLAKLQHANIVPIYSIHSAGALRAVCMPYRGGTTLADVIRGLRGSKSLPESGRHIVSTLNDRKLSTQKPTSSTGSAQASDSAEPNRQPLNDPLPAIGVAPSQLGNSVERPPTSPRRTVLDRFAGQSYVESILWIGVKLADGLAHAHDCDIIHRDLKPANVLLTDEGQPMLLDFNLADNATRRGSEAARMGGTLPYMSPEQLMAFRSGKSGAVDARTDIYSLGLILFELLTGRPAFPPRTGRVRDSLPAMLTDRGQPPPRLTPLNPAVTPAVEAIIRHCLEPNPDRRYPSARALMEDIERHLANLPLRHTSEPSIRERLRKWRRRHPKLASWSTASVVAAAALIAGISWTVIHGRELVRLKAVEQFSGLDSVRNVQLVRLNSVMNSSDAAHAKRAAAAARAALAPYGLPDNPDWRTGPLVTPLTVDEQERLAVIVGGMLRIWAVAEQRCAKQGDRADEGLALATRLKEQAATLLGNDSAEDQYFLGRALVHKRDFTRAIPRLLQVTQQDRRHFWAWNDLAGCHLELGQLTEAIECYGACVGMATDPVTTYFAHMHRSKANLIRTEYQAAKNDVEAAIACLPELPDDVLHSERPNAYLLLSEVLMARGKRLSNQSDFAAAEKILTDALAFGDDMLLLYLRRSEVRALRKDQDGAARDWEEMLKLEPANERDWTFRGLAHLEKDDPKAALADYDRALQLNPNYYLALQNKANVLSDKLGKDDESLVVLNRIVDLYPDYVKARIGRGVVLARQGKRAAAHADAIGSLARAENGETLYMAANIYALTSKQEPKDAERVYPLLAAALMSGFGFDVIEKDDDMAPVRDRPWFRQLIAIAQTIRADMSNDSKAK